MDKQSFLWEQDVYFCWVAQDASEAHNDILGLPVVLVGPKNSKGKCPAHALDVPITKLVKPDIRIRWSDLQIMSYQDILDYTPKVKEVAKEIQHLLRTT